MIMEILKLLAKRGQLVPLCEEVVIIVSYDGLFFKIDFFHCDNQAKRKKTEKLQSDKDPVTT